MSAPTILSTLHAEPLNGALKTQSLNVALSWAKKTYLP
jgi:hypothetical protein